jgi:2-phospho-L-lactate guanylyltransferase
MRVYGALPLRRLADAKGRLGALLSPEERGQLAFGLLERAAAALLEGGVERALVITRDRQLGAADLSADPRLSLALQEPQLPGLNGALRQAQHWAREADADALLIVLPDLPLLTAADVRAMLNAARESETAVLAPDRAGAGSNALLLAPPDIIAPSFGEGSARRHRAALALAGVPLTVLRRPGLALDLDTADDLAALRQRGHSWRAYLRAAEASAQA